MTNPDETYATKRALQELRYQEAYHWSTERHVEAERYDRMTRLLIEVACKSSRFDPKDPLLILDFGCGDGRGSFAIWRQFKTQEIEVRVIGLDISKNAIAWARRMTAERADGSLAFYLGDVAKLFTERPDLREARFVIMREVLEHLPEDEIDRILGAFRTRIPKAELVVSVPSNNSPIEKKHFRHYTAETLAQTLERNGYGCAVVTGYGFRPRALFRPLRFAKKILNKKRLLWRLMNPAWRQVRPEWAITLVARGCLRPK